MIIVEDRREIKRRALVRRLVGWLVTSLTWFFLGVGFGKLLCHL